MDFWPSLTLPSFSQKARSTSKRVGFYFPEFRGDMSQQFTQFLINELGETKSREGTKLTLMFVTKAMSENDCIKIIREAKSAYAFGELICDKSRQRTLGGCFFKRLPGNIRKESYKKAKKLRKQINESLT